MRGLWWIAAAAALGLTVAYCSLKPERRAAASGRGDIAAAGPTAKQPARPKEGHATGGSSGEQKGQRMTSDPRYSSDRLVTEPGDVVLTPEHDPTMIYDPITGRVTDSRNGDWFASRSVDPEFHAISYRIMSKDDKLLHTFTTSWQLIEQDAQRKIAVRVEHARKADLPFEESLQYLEDLSLERFGKFLKFHPSSKNLQATELIIVDRREKYRSGR